MLRTEVWTCAFDRLLDTVELHTLEWVRTMRFWSYLNYKKIKYALIPDSLGAQDIKRSNVTVKNEKSFDWFCYLPKKIYHLSYISYHDIYTFFMWKLISQRTVRIVWSNVKTFARQALFINVHHWIELNWMIFSNS